MTKDSKKALGQVVQIDERRINNPLRELVRGKVEKNAMSLPASGAGT